MHNLNRGEDFWVVLGGKTPSIKLFNEFRPEIMIFSESEIHFYGTLTVDEKLVGFVISSAEEDLCADGKLPNVEYIGDSVFPAFLLCDVDRESRIVSHGEELFGDLSLHKDANSQYAFLFHNIDNDHPLSELFRRHQADQADGRAGVRRGIRGSTETDRRGRGDRSE